MSDSKGPSELSPAVDWHQAALVAVRSPGAWTACPACRAESLSASWNVVDLVSGEALVELRCDACHDSQTVRILLPPDAANFFPVRRMAAIGEVLREQITRIADSIREHSRAMPAATFTTDPRWEEAGWSATTFQWHPKSEAPPVMGIVFDNADVGKALFADLVAKQSNSDRFEELCVSIIEGSFPGQLPGYTVHLYPDQESLGAYATGEGFVVNPRIVPFLGRWNRSYPIPGSPPLLARFKQEFERHKEFMLAPVTRRADGQLWVDVELGIVKNTISLRNLSEIAPDDIDAGALVLPCLITQKPVG